MLKHLKVGVCALAALAGIQSAHATLTQNWRVDSAAAGPLLFQDSRNRGMAFNPATNHVLMTDNSVGTIRVINGATGASIGNMVVTGVTGASVNFHKLKVLDLGGGNYAVFLLGLTTTSKANDIVIFRWYGSAAASEDTLAAPTCIYRNRAANALTATGSPIGPAMPAVGAPHTERTGDAWAITNSGSTVQFYTLRTLTFRNDNVLRFDYTDPGSGAAGSVSAVTNIPLTGMTGYAFGTASAAGLAVDGFGGDLLVCTRSNGFSGVFSNSGVFKGLLGGTTFTSGHPTIATLANGSKLMGYVYDGDPAAAGSSYSRAALADITNGTTQGICTDFSGNTLATAITNVNATGDVAFDPATNRVFTMTSNHVLASYTHAASAAGVTKTWSGTAGDNNWFTASNWTPSGVPTINDDVVLNHSSLAGAYEVAIGTSTADAQARTIAVGDGTAPLIQLSLATTNTLRQAVTLQGSKTADTVIVSNNAQLNYLSGAAAGTIWYSMDPGVIFRIKNGGTQFCNTPRSYSTPFGADLPAGFARNLYGVITFEPTSNLTIAGTDIFTGAGRTYGNVNINVAGSIGSGGVNQTMTVNNLTIASGLAYPITISAPLLVNGTFTNNGNAASYSALPLTFNTSQNFPTNITPLGDTLIPSGVTVTFPNSVTVGTATNGRGLRVAGNAVINSGVTMTVNSYLAPLTGSSVSGAGSIVYGASAGIGTDNAAGIASGATPAEITVASPGTIPAATAGQFAFLGTANQSLGAYLSGGTVGGLVINKPNYAKLATGGALQVNSVLSMTTGVLDASGSTVTLGTTAAATGVLVRPTDGGLVLGSYRKWVATAAAVTDFPLTDAGNRLRIFTTSTTGTATAGGTIEVAYTTGNPDTSMASASPGGLVNSSSNFNKVDASGFYTLWTANGFNPGAAANGVDFIVNVDGFNTGLDGSDVGLVTRPGPGNAWTIPTGSYPAPLSINQTRFIKFSQGLINYAINPLQAVRRNGSSALSFLTAGGNQFALGGPSTLVPVTLTGVSVE